MPAQPYPPQDEAPEPPPEPTLGDPDPYRADPVARHPGGSVAGGSYAGGSVAGGFSAGGFSAGEPYSSAGYSPDSQLTSPAAAGDDRPGQDAGPPQDPYSSGRHYDPYPASPARDGANPGDSPDSYWDQPTGSQPGLGFDGYGGPQVGVRRGPYAGPRPGSQPGPQAGAYDGPPSGVGPDPFAGPQSGVGPDRYGGPQSGVGPDPFAGPQSGVGPDPYAGPQPRPGAIVSRGPLAEPPSDPHPAAPSSYPGDRYPRDRYPRDQYPGHQYPGHPYPGHPYPGDPYPGSISAASQDSHARRESGPMPGFRQEPDARGDLHAADVPTDRDRAGAPTGPLRDSVPQDPYPAGTANASETKSPQSGSMASAAAPPGQFPGRDDNQNVQGGNYADDDEEPDGAYDWEPEGPGWPEDPADPGEEDAGDPIVPMGGGGRRNRRGQGRARRQGRRFSAPLIALLVLAVFLAGGGMVGYHFLREYVIPPDYSGSGNGTVVIQIQQNQTASDVAKTLFGLGVVASPRAFVKAAEQSSQETALEPGFYRLHRRMKAALAFGLLLNPDARIQLRITIPEGLRATQVAAALGAKSGIPLKSYLAALADPVVLGLPSYAGNRPEGYLFPATYPVQPRMTAAEVLRAMVQQFDAEATKIHLVSTARSVHLTPAEAIVVASLVQAEGGREADFPKIARVIYNRLAVNMQLQLDSTVMYALQTYGILATNQQLEVNSRYNTYRHTGLPPGPIDNPGDAAIHAALHPAVGNWLYFITVNPKSGLTEFTSSPTEFAQLRAELAKNLGQG